jgi:hypothetical protein
MKDIINQLRMNSECLAPSIMLKAADEIERLRAERDEARREVCRNEANHLPTMADPRREAQRRGWDCFEEYGNA